jgi:hypothetical protein
MSNGSVVVCDLGSSSCNTTNRNGCSVQETGTSIVASQLPWHFASSQKRGERAATIWLCGLNSITIDSNGNRPLNALYRNNEAPIIARRHEDSLHSVETSTADTYLLTDTQKWVICKRKFLSQDFLNGLDLFIGYRSARASHSDKGSHSIRPQNHSTLAEACAYSNKDVVGEQGKLNFLTSVAPLMDRVIKRKKDLNVLLFELEDRLLFVPGLSLKGKPLPSTSCRRRLE